jgi:hypothetical protein
MVMARMSDERWNAIWEGALDSTARLLAGDSPPSSEGAELASVIELPAPVESGDEPKGDDRE